MNSDFLQDPGPIRNLKAQMHLKKADTQTLISEIFSNLGPMVWSKDIANGKVLFLTQNFSSFFEIPMDLLELDPGLMRKAIHPDDLPFVDIFSKNLLSYQTEEVEYRIITPNGKVKWLAEKKQIIKNDLGEIVRLDMMLLDITRQKEEERRLTDSESTYKSLFYGHVNPMWIYDTESLYFLAVNNAAIRYYGYTHDEFFKMTIRQIRPKEDVEEFLQSISSGKYDGESTRISRHLLKDGRKVYVRITSQPILFRGKTARWVMIQDVSNEVESENKSHQILHTLENFRDAISKNSLLAQINGRFELEYVNQVIANRTGKSEIQWIGQHFSSLFSPIYRKNQLDDIAANLEKGKIWMGERKFYGKGNQHFWVRCSFIPLKANQNGELSYLMLADDITNLKEAEKRSKEFALRLHNIIEGITDSIFVLDKKWLIADLNQAAESLLSQKRKFLVGKNFWELLPEEEGFRFYQFFRKARKRKVTVEFEEYFQPKDQWFDISLYPSNDGLAVCFRDVSDRRKKEEERKELMDQLIVQNRDLEEFTYIASHSLRAQIANISMLCAAMDNGGLTPANQEIFERLYQSSSHLDTIISDLNTILTIKDRSSVLVEEVSVQNCFINVLSRLPQNLAPFKKAVRLEAEPGIMFHSVRTYVEALVFQLISNSLRFRSLEREPEVVVRVHREKNHCEITITDNGRGFDAKKVRKQIFQLYKTFHPGTSGKGLGLYLAKILVDELKGVIHLDSVSGEGTRVHISIPEMPR